MFKIAFAFFDKKKTPRLSDNHDSITSFTAIIFFELRIIRFVEQVQLRVVWQ